MHILTTGHDDTGTPPFEPASALRSVGHQLAVTRHGSASRLSHTAVAHHCRRLAAHIEPDRCVHQTPEVRTRRRYERDATEFAGL